MRNMLLGIAFGLFCLDLQAGVLNADCTAEKAAKSAAMKATVGVGGRCDMKEAASDTVGLDDKKDAVSDSKDKVGDLKDDNLGRKAAKKAIND
ncbi:MAG: hypothetical protein ACRERX_22135 [Pseudomonas sp.]